MVIRIKKHYDNSILMRIIAFSIIAIIIGHFMLSLSINEAIINYINIACWFILLVYCLTMVLLKRAKVNSRYIVFYMIYFLFTLLGWIIGQSYYPEIKNFEGDLFVNLASIFICLFVSMNVKVQKSSIESIYNIIIILGLFSVIYAMIVQSNLILNVIRGIDSARSSWNYYSFFMQRNRFSQFCLLCFEITIYQFFNKKKNIFFISALLFAFNILITDSQTSIVCALFFVVVFSYMKSNNKIFLFAIAAVLFVALVPMVSTDNLEMLLSRHVTETGANSAQYRYLIWLRGFDQLSRSKTFLFGLGEDSNYVFLSKSHLFGSFHNLFVDALFEGGIFRLVFYVTILVLMWRKANCFDDYLYRGWQKSVLMTYWLFGNFEAGSAFFKSNFFGYITSVVFLFLINNTDESVRINE